MTLNKFYLTADNGFKLLIFVGPIFLLSWLTVLKGTVSVMTFLAKVATPNLKQYP